MAVVGEENSGARKKPQNSTGQSLQEAEMDDGAAPSGVQPLVCPSTLDSSGPAQPTGAHSPATEHRHAEEARWRRSTSEADVDHAAADVDHAADVEQEQSFSSGQSGSLRRLGSPSLLSRNKARVDAQPHRRAGSPNFRSQIELQEGDQGPQVQRSRSPLSSSELLLAAFRPARHEEGSAKRARGHFSLWKHVLSLQVLLGKQGIWRLRQGFLLLLCLGTVLVLFDVSLTAQVFGAVRRLHDVPLVDREHMALGWGAQEGGADPAAVTIFCAPKPFEGDAGESQRTALLSWLRHRPTPNVVLLGEHPSFNELAHEFSPHVTVDGDIDSNFRGLPLFNSIIARAQAAKTGVSLFVNADIILMENVFTAIKKVSSRHPAWLVTGMRWDIRKFPFVLSQDPSVPFGYGASVQLKWRNGSAATDLQVVEHVEAHGVLHTYGGTDFFAWNNAPGVPLVKGPFPPFAYGRARFDNWFVHEVVATGERAVVDASLTATSIHIHHTYRHVKDKQAVSVGNEERSFWSLNKGRTFESFLNVHLSQRYGSNFSNQMGTAFHTPWKLGKCLGSKGQTEPCLLPRHRPGACACEDGPHTVQDQQKVLLVEGRTWKCGTVSIDKPYSLSAIPTEDSPAGLPHRFQDLLKEVAPRKSPLILTGVSKEHIPLLQNFACQLRLLKANNFIVAAYDEEAYRSAFEQGLAVYYEPAAWRPEPIPGGATTHPVCSQSLPCGESQLAQVKLSSIRRVLKLGHSVLWSDVDVIWRTNVLPILSSLSSEPTPIFLETDLQPKSATVLQGSGNFPAGAGRTLVDEGAQGQPQETEKDKAALLGSLGISSSDQAGGEDLAAPVVDPGLFFLPSSTKTVAFVESMLKQAASVLGAQDQPMYLDAVCGPKGERYDRTRGECVTSQGLRVQFVDQSLRVRSLRNDVRRSLPNSELARAGDLFFVLHLGAVHSVKTKVALLKGSGMWHYSQHGLMCIRKWHRTTAQEKVPPLTMV